MYFIALVFPTNYVNLYVPPNPGIKPNFNSGSPNLQSSVATKISPFNSVSKLIFEMSLIFAPAQNTLSSLDNKIKTLFR